MTVTHAAARPGLETRRSVVCPRRMSATPYHARVERAVRDEAGAIPPLQFWSAAVVVTIALIVSRRPDGIWHAQFWAEDGKIWYADAYNEGPLRALLFPAAGYLQSFSRLAAALSVAFDLRHAPLVMNVAAVLVQAL